jgi:UDP-N-acetylenolpyruvoylglucosamine reductase
MSKAGMESSVPPADLAGQSREGPLEGRRIWFVGIGGAGLSAYATIAAAWGAEVGGWDRVETSYLGPLRGHELVIAPEPVVPGGWETVVSSAYPGIPGRSRAEFLAELVSLRDSVVVAGAHGKTTTSGMIAFVLSRLGRDPAFAIGGDIPQLGGNAGAGEGWFVVEGDESDRTIAALRPRVAVVLNVELDHHVEFASLAELEAMFDEWLAHVPHVVHAEELEPVGFELALAGAHNRLNAAAALAALEHCGVGRADAETHLAEFRGASRRFELRGEEGGVRIYDDYAHHPTEIAETLATARQLGARRVLVLFQPHLYSRTRHLAQEFGIALSSADAVAVADVYRARELPIDGVTGKLIVDEIRGTRAGWMPSLESGAHWLVSLAREGDIVLTVGAGDVDRAVPILLEQLSKPVEKEAAPRTGRLRRMGSVLRIEEGVSLARYTTLGTGGPARWFARPDTVDQLEETLTFASQQEVGVAVVGLGSNLLAADEGVGQLVLKLGGELAAVAVASDGVSAGGGATNAVVLHRAREAGLGGFEFACAIPGTTGGGVWMNAGAYGGDFAQVLERALVVSAAGPEWLTPTGLGLTYRRSDLQEGQVVARVELRLATRSSAEIKATIARLQAQRKSAQPTNKRTFGSVFENPDHDLTAGRMLEACGLKGHRIGGAQISPKHANFIENAGGARSADAIALMIEARRRAFAQFGVELRHEVRFLGVPELPSVT